MLTLETALHAFRFSSDAAVSHDACNDIGNLTINSINFFHRFSNVRYLDKDILEANKSGNHKASIPLLSS